MRCEMRLTPGPGRSAKRQLRFVAAARIAARDRDENSLQSSLSRHRAIRAETREAEGQQYSDSSRRRRGDEKEDREKRRYVLAEAWYLKRS